MNRFSKYLSHLLLCVLTTMSVPLPLWSQATQGSITLSQVDDPNLVDPPHLKATVERAAYAPWVVERSLAMTTGANGSWFSYYQEPGTRISAFAVSTGVGPNGPIVDPITLRLRDLPAYPPPLPASSPTPGWTRPRYLHAHTILQLAANGAVYARWPSLGTASVAETVFNVVGGVPELNLLNPDPEAENQNRPIFGVGIRHQTASATLPPIIISYSVSQRPASSPMPTSLPVLTGDDAIIRQGLIAFGLAIRDDCWPELGPAGPPAPPPTLNDRSFYRLKSLAALHDANNNHFPDELEGYFSNLMISEVCYASLTAVDAHQPHVFPPADPGGDPRPAFLNRPPDWVEILNPTGQAISTGNYFLSDKNTNLGRSRLPDVSIPAYGTLILLLSDSPHPLFGTEGDPASMVRKCWITEITGPGNVVQGWRLKDEGESIFLSQDNTPTTTDPLTLVDSLTPPQIGTTALTGYTVGKVPRANHTWQTVFLPASSVNQVN